MVDQPREVSRKYAFKMCCCTWLQNRLLTADEPFYPDVVLFPSYLDHPVSLKNIPLCMAH